MATKKHSDVKMDKKMMQTAVNKHEANLHKGQPKTKLAKGGGIKIRGTGAATQGTKAYGPMA
jgi:hypothetical protein